MIVVICSIGLITTGYALVFSPENFSRSETSKTVGSVEPSGADIRVRGDGDQSWNQVGREANVFSNDRIFTGERSQAVVTLKNDAKFTLEPNSLVVISDKENKQTIEVNKGGFQADLKKGTRLYVKYKGKETEVASSDTEATVRLGASDEGAINLTVVKGEAQVKLEDATEAETLTVNSEIEIAKEEIPEVVETITLRSPASGEEKLSDETTIEFEWEKETHASTHLEISSEPDFSSKVISVEVTEHKKSVEIPEKGVYFWRVVDAKNPNITSPVSSFSLREPVKENILAEEPVAEVVTRMIAQVVEEPPPPPPPPVEEEKPIEVVAPEPEPAPIIPEALAPEVSKVQHPESWFWLGLGGNYQFYTQTLPSVSGETKFQDIQGPNIHLRAGFQGPKHGLDLAYKDTPGKMASSTSVTVKNGDFRWQTLLIEGLYRLSDFLNLRYGLQHHLMPFMVLDTTEATINVKTNVISMATIGFDKHIPLSETLRAEWMMRYQHPLSSGGAGGIPFAVKPKLAFDGSIGGVYSVSKTTRLGVYWYGQMHQYSFTYGKGDDQFAGDQTLFYSNIEVRLGVEF